MRKVSIRISLSMVAGLPGQTLFASCGFPVLEIITLYIYLLRRNVLARISLRGLRMLIWVDTLHRVHNVGGTAHMANSTCVFITKSCYHFMYFLKQHKEAHF